MAFEFSRSRATRTTEGYELCWKDFERFCAKIEAESMPALPQTVLEFLRFREPTHSQSALSYRKNAILAAHKDARALLPRDQREPYMLENDDMLKLGWREISRKKGNRHTPRQAITGPMLRDIFAQAIPADTPVGIMDRAILLIHRAILMRRSEVAALNLEDIRFADDVMYVTIRKSKTDQTAIGVTLVAAKTGNEMCPVTAMERWIEVGKVREALPDTDGKVPLFASPRYRQRRRIDNTYSYAITKRYGAIAGLDPKPLGSHSYRRGGITDINDAGISRKDGMALSRHKSGDIYDHYIADKEAAKNPAVTAIAGAF